jgi:hypothetical protein
LAPAIAPGFLLALSEGISANRRPLVHNSYTKNQRDGAFSQGRKHMSSNKVGQDRNYVAHHVEVAISSREAEIRARKLRQFAVLACVVGFLLVAAFIVL